MLTKKDKKLLYELDSNYRQSYTQIGRKIRMSQQLISYKINSLLKKKIITSFFPLLDYSRFGYLNFIVFFKVHYINEQAFNHLIKKLKEVDEIISIIECEGHYDLIVTFSALNPSAFNKKLKQLLVENPKELRDNLILTTVVEHYFSRNYLTGSKEVLDTIIGGDRNELPIDALNRKIVATLLDGKKNLIEIAAQTGSTPKTVISRLKLMEQNGIIKKYRLLLNIKKLGFSVNVVLVRYRNITFEEEEQFRQYCKFHPNIVYFAKTFGEWDVIIIIESKNPQEFRNIFLQLREKFDEFIEKNENFIIFQIHKKQLLPYSALLNNASKDGK